MQNNKRNDYIVKGNKFNKPLPPIGYNQEEEDAQIYFQKIMLGNIDVDQMSDPQPKEVRIFLSSTFSDFKIERNIIIKKVLPEIESTCNAFGLHLRFCDMRWGVTDSAVNEHLVEKLCINEIEMCRKNSIGPFFVLLIGNRYGYKPIPSEIPSEEFEMLQRIIEDKCPKETELFNKWFKKDENAQPPVHILLPIKTHVPHYADYNDDVKRRESGNEWWSIEERIRRTLCKISKVACVSGQMTKYRRAQLIRSVTETELWSAILKNQADIDKVEVDRCLAYERQLTGLLEDLQSDMAIKYIDCVKVNDEFVCDQDCLTALAEFKRKIKKIGLKNYRQYLTPWSSRGISEDIVTHQNYLDKLCKNMASDLKDLIISRMTTLENFSKRFDKAKNYLQAEVVNHWQFCRQRSRRFCGRTDQLKTVFEFIFKDCSHPIIVHGDSGSGKTTFLSKIASQLQMDSLKISDQSPITCDCFTTNQSPTIIVRFLGTSASSSTLQQLLFSICFQIQVAYKMRVQFRKMSSLSSLQWLFNNLLLVISRKYANQFPLVIILDSLDQLLVSSAGIDRLQKKHVPYSWIPKQTPPGVHIIISLALDPNNTGLFQNVSQHLSDCQSMFIEMKCLENDEVKSILDTMYRYYRRSLVKEQMDYVVNVLTNNSQALFINITIEETLTWTSILPQSEWLLAPTIESAIQQLFSRLENRYGTVLIGYTLGYLTLGLNGLSELEIEDLLSLHDLVLNEVYQYHDPPIKGILRIPSLLWARIHSDLSSYIVEKRTDGKLTMAWYHRHFYQCALERYVITPGYYRQLHTEISHYFSITSSYSRDCTLNNKKRSLEIKDANRLISCTPISSKEPRKLHAMSYHLVESEQDDILAKDCVANLHYLRCYLDCFGIQELILWLKGCATSFPDNHAINIIKNCIVFIEPLLEADTHHLPVQLLGQLLHLDAIIPSMDRDNTESYSKTMSLLKSLCDQCRLVLEERPCLIPSIASFPSSLGSIKLYKENIDRVIPIPWNPSLVILVGQQKNEWIVRLFQTNDCVSLCSIGCEFKPCAVALPTVNQSCIFIQDCRNIFMYDIDTGILEAKHGLYINNKIMLNECMAVDSNGKWVAIAAQNRIAILEYKQGTTDKSPLFQRYIITAREVDKTLAMSFIQIDRHSLLLTAHYYNSKTQRQFLIKLWQFEQNNELWSLDLASLSNKHADFVYLWPLSQQNVQSQAKECNDNGSTIIVLPNSSSYFIGNIFDVRSVMNLTELDSSKSNKDLLRSVTSDGDTVTITRTLNHQTFIHSVNRQGSVTTVDLPKEIHQKSITCAVVNASTKSLLIGLRSGNISYIRGNTTTSWRAHRSSVDYLTSLHEEGSDILKLMSFSHTEKVIKCWSRHDDPPVTDDKFSKSIFEEMNAFALSSATNSFVIVDANFSELHCSAIDNVATDIRHLPITLVSKQSLDMDNEPDSMLVTDMEIVFSGQGVLIFFDNRIQLYNISKSEIIYNLNLPQKSSEKIQRNYWHVVDESSTLLLLTFDSSTGYFHLEFRRLPAIGTIVSTKLFLAPVNMSHPHTQLEKIDLISSKRKKFLIILWKNSKLTSDLAAQDPNTFKIKDYFLCSSLNLKDPSQTLCLTPCCNLEETKKNSGRNVISKTSNQLIFSYAMPPETADAFPSDVLSENIIVIGGLGEILVWDLESGLCRIPKAPYFHTWFKHSVTINTQSDTVLSSERSYLRSDSKQGKARSLSDSNPKDFYKFPITALLLSHQSAIVVSGCASGYIVVWRWIATLSLCGNEPDPVRKFRFILSVKHDAQVNCLALTQDCRLLVSGSADMALFLSDINTNDCLHRISIHCSPISLSFCCIKDEETEKFSKVYLVCHSVHVGQNRMMLFDVVDPGLGLQ